MYVSLSSEEDDGGMLEVFNYENLEERVWIMSCHVEYNPKAEVNEIWIRFTTIKNYYLIYTESWIIRLS